MAETQIAALNGDDGRPFLVQLECTTEPDNGMQDEPLPAPVVVLWVLPYGSHNMAVGAHLNPALARQLAADLVRMADECEGKPASAEVTAAQLAALEATVQASLFANRCPLCGYLPHTDDCPLRDGYDMDRLVANHQAIKREIEEWLRRKLEAL